MNLRSKMAGLLFIVSLFLLPFCDAQNKKRYYTGDNTDEKEFNKIEKSPEALSRGLENLPSSYSFKQYAPVPGDQGKHGTCVAWSTAYAARTISYCIQHQITDTAQIRAYAFSPSYLYYYVKTAGDNNCQSGAKIESALKVLSDTGDVMVSPRIPDCVNAPDPASEHTAKNYTIKAYSSINNAFGRITKDEVVAIKSSIAQNNPIILSINCFSSLFDVGKDGIWKPVQNDTVVGSHALCIVGYDDDKLGGAFEVMNSWGTDWGNGGFFWLTYDQVMQYCSYALEMMDREDYAGAASRGLDAPRLMGALDFVLVNEEGSEAAPMKVSRTRVDLGGSLINDDSSAGFSNYVLTQDYAGGTKFKIRFVTNAPAFVYIFSIDNHRVVSSLFPYADNVSAAINSKDAIIYLPREGKRYSLDANASRDQICILYSKSAIDFHKLKTQILKSSANIYATINALYINQIIPVKNINFKDDHISFNATASEQQLICFFVDMNHK